VIGSVRVRNLEFQGNHGASAAERRTARRFQVDVDLRLDLARAMAGDRLADTVNYHELCAMIVEIGSSRTFRLLEGLAGAMLGEIRARWPHAAVELELRKLHPPCPGNPSYTAVRVHSDAG
jgi:dihydroneopterin aldolase